MKEAGLEAFIMRLYRQKNKVRLICFGFQVVYKHILTTASSASQKISSAFVTSPGVLYNSLVLINLGF